MSKLIDKIGEDFVARAIRTFYERAFIDPMICHFFMNSDIEHLSAQQTKFAIAMLGGPKNYDGPHLDKAHEKFDVRPPHFGRRQVLMREVLDELGLESELSDQWMAMEEKFRSKITKRPRPHS